MKIYVMAEVPDELGQAWLQHLRDFDVAHPGCVFEVLASAPEMGVEAMRAALEVAPGFPEIRVVRWPERSEGVQRGPAERFGVKGDE